jgi:chaperonin GroES
MRDYEPWLPVRESPTKSEARGGFYLERYLFGTILGLDTRLLSSISYTSERVWHSQLETAKPRFYFRIINFRCMAKLKPLHDHLIVKPISDEQATKAGIILPDTLDKERPEKGEVIATGPGKMGKDGKRLEMSVKVGDKIIFKKYSPSEIKIDQDKFLVVEESDVLAIVE